LRALSIRQPYVELILRGDKTAEYRTRPTRLRERVYLYACRTPGPAAAYDDAKLTAERLPHGWLVGTVEIVGCQETDTGFTWELARPQRLSKHLAVTRMPQPGFFWPWE
jgi:hypothetical protein